MGIENLIVQDSQNYVSPYQRYQEQIDTIQKRKRNNQLMDLGNLQMQQTHQKLSEFEANAPVREAERQDAIDPAMRQMGAMEKWNKVLDGVKDQQGYAIVSEIAQKKGLPIAGSYEEFVASRKKPMTEYQSQSLALQEQSRNLAREKFDYEKANPNAGGNAGTYSYKNVQVVGDSGRGMMLKERTHSKSGKVEHSYDGGNTWTSPHPSAVPYETGSERKDAAEARRLEALQLQQVAEGRRTEAEQRMQVGQEFTQEKALRDRYDKSKESVAETRLAIQNVLALLDMPQTPLRDIELQKAASRINNTNVRAISELDKTKNFGSLWGRTKGLASSLAFGEKTDDQIEQFRALANDTLTNFVNPTLKKYEDMSRGLAEMYDLNPDRVTPVMPIDQQNTGPTYKIVGGKLERVK